MKRRLAVPILLAAVLLLALWWRHPSPRVHGVPGDSASAKIEAPAAPSGRGTSPIDSGAGHGGAQRLRLRVLVLDKESGAVLQEAPVYVSANGQTTWDVCREGGVVFDLNGNGGEMDVSIIAARAMDSTIWEIVTAHASPALPETLVTVRLGSGSTARVHVEGEDGKPIDGAFVEICGQSAGPTQEGREWKAKGRTSPTGDVEIPGIDPGHVSAIVVQAHKYVGTGIDAPECMVAFSSRLIVRLAQSMRVSGQVVDAAGRPISGANISYRETIVFGDWRGTRTIDGYPHVSSAGDGRFEFYDSLDPGATIEVHALASSYAPGKSPPAAVPESGSTIDVRVQMRPSGQLHLIIHDQLGRAYSGAVVVRPDGPSDRDWQHLKTNEDGELLVDSLDPDFSYVIEAKPARTLSGKKAGGAIELEITKPDANPHRLTISLPE